MTLELSPDTASFDTAFEGSASSRDLPPSPPTSVAVVEALATGAPLPVFEQDDAAAQVAELFDEPEARARIARVYRNTRILRRHLAVNPLDPEFEEFSKRPATIRERMTMFAELAAPIAIDVARRATAGLDDVTEIGQLVFVTSTGFIAPGVDVSVLRALGLPPTTHRAVINFMGCAAAMNGLRAGSDFVRANPDRKSLVICLELSSVNAVFGEDPIALITHSLFGDGCGAMLLGASNVGHPQPAGSIVLRDEFSHLFDDAEDGIVLGVNDDGITCELSPELPDYIYRGVAPVIDDVLTRNKLGRDDIDLWAVHPGGPKIITESLRSLDLPDEVAAASWDVLAEYGNMLSVSLIFVLERMIAAQAAAASSSTGAVTTGLAFSFAPGVTLEGILFDVVQG
ncbi:MAG: 3-oxoacyl-[acyl-carrier-protein] synthase III C-terminal domain-containing protein [Gordonia sp. (in: high G+C Gram-positive bacteria)]